MELAPVAGDAVQQDEPGIDLELVQIKSPYPRITGNHYGDYACSAVSFCKVVTQEPQMPAAAGGRAEILLEKEVDTDAYHIPFHYVRADEKLDNDSLWYRTEDDGDLVIMRRSLNECTRRKKDKGWTSLDKLRELSIQRNEYFNVCHNIYRLFLSLCPFEGESGIMNKVSAMLESVKVDRAKKEYVEKLARFLNGEIPDSLDSYEKLPNPDLVRKEMDTLAHFRLRRLNPIPMNQQDGYLLDNDLYTFERIDWVALGAKRTHRRNPLFDDWFVDAQEDA